MFKQYDKVRIIGNNSNFIDGIHNHMTREVKKDIFGFYIFTSSFWGNILAGHILFIGKDNHYIIRSGNDYFVFCNVYNEMELI